MEYLAEKARRMSPSPTLGIDALAKAMLAKGLDVVNFGVGEPDFPTPEPIVEAAIRALRDGMTKYAPAAGLPALREAIAAKLRRENGLDYAPGEVVVSVGAKHVLYNLFQVLLNEGDEVLIPSPHWVSYPEQVKLAGVVPVFVPTAATDGFRLTAAALRPRITAKTRALIINSPNNPTGAVYPPKDLEEIAQNCLTRGILIISDEVYEKLVYGEATHTSIGSLAPEMKAITVVVNALSKAYAMTGWRLGYAAGPAPLIKAVADLQSQSTSNVTTFVQPAAVQALNGPQDELERMVAEFTVRRSLMLEGVAGIPWLSVQPPRGAFYLFPALAPGLPDDARVAEILLEEGPVALVPGSGFGAPGHLRFSYAVSRERIAAGLERVGTVLQRLAGEG